MGGRGTNGATTQGSAFATAAAELATEVSRFEALTERLERAKLDSDEELTKAAALLAQAAESHQRFVDRLRAVVAGVEDARQRQNQSAVTLSGVEEALVARRRTHDALRHRFAALGEATRALRERIESGEIATARPQLAELVATANDLAGEARSAALTDLEREGHAMSQALEALSRKIA